MIHPAQRHSGQKHGAWLYFPLSIVLVSIICTLAVFKLRTNRYGLPPLGEPRTEKIQNGNYAYLKEYITGAIQQRIKQLHLVGLSIALVDDRELILSEGFGFQNREENISATDKTIYNLGSVTKVITATAIMQLVEQGKIDLDAPIKKYLSDFAVRTRFNQMQPVTVRNLLTHHSGLPGDREINQFTRQPYEHFSIAVDHLKNEYTAYPPDHVWAYSNLGFNLLGVIIERVSGIKYADYIRRNIFEPLEMKNSAVNKHDISSKLYSKVYRVKDNTSYWYAHFRDQSTGGLLSNVDDMSRFMRMVLNSGSSAGSTILQPETLDEMLTEQNKDIALDLGFKIGLGWYLDRTYFRYAGRFCGHGGDFAAVHTQMSMLPEHKLGVIVVSNSDNSAIVVREIADIALQLALQIKTGLTPPRAAPQNATSADQNLFDFEGGYATQYGHYMIKSDGGSLKLKIKETHVGMPWLTMVRNHDGWYSARFPFLTIPNFRHRSYPFCTLPNFRLYLHQVGKNRYMSLEKTGDQYPFGVAFEKKPAAEVWKNRVGKYRLLNHHSEMDVQKYPDWRITFEDGILILKAKKAYILEPVTDNEAIILCLGRNCHETVRFSIAHGQDKIEYAGLEYGRINDFD